LPSTLTSFWEGTRRLSSSNQLSTSWMTVGAGGETVSGDCTNTNRWPSGATSNPGSEVPDKSLSGASRKSCLLT